MISADGRIFCLDAGEPGLGLTVRPGPRVTEPQCGQHVQRGVARRAVVHGDPATILGPGLGVLDLDVEVLVAGEHTGVQELVLELVPGTVPVGRDQVVVGNSACGYLYRYRS